MIHAIFIKRYLLYLWWAIKFVVMSSTMIPGLSTQLVCLNENIFNVFKALIQDSFFFKDVYLMRKRKDPSTNHSIKCNAADQIQVLTQTRNTLSRWTTTLATQNTFSEKQGGRKGGGGVERKGWYLLELMPLKFKSTFSIKAISQYSR